MWFCNFFMYINNGRKGPVGFQEISQDNFVYEPVLRASIRHETGSHERVRRKNQFQKHGQVQKFDLSTKRKYTMIELSKPLHVPGTAWHTSVSIMTHA